MGESPWAPPRMIAAMVLGEGVLPMPREKPATFDLGVIMAAMMIHFVLSIIYGLIGAAIVAHRMGYGTAIALGALAGLAIYLINSYPVAQCALPLVRNGARLDQHLRPHCLRSSRGLGIRRPPQARSRTTRRLLTGSSTTR
jgi:hypothetical protein